MGDVELINFFAKEGVTFLAILLVYFLFVKPKDGQITELVKANQTMMKETSENLGEISTTMSKISDEMQLLSKSQQALKDGQDELWKEVVRLKGEDANG